MHTPHTWPEPGGGLLRPHARRAGHCDSCGGLKLLLAGGMRIISRQLEHLCLAHLRLTAPSIALKSTAPTWCRTALGPGVRLL